MEQPGRGSVEKDIGQVKPPGFHSVEAGIKLIGENRQRCPEAKHDAGAGVAKEATVEQLRTSKGIAGVSMRLEPGVMRERHWHPNADVFISGD